MINVTDLRSGKAFAENGQLFEVLSYEHIKMGRGSANIKVKAKNLRSGAITERSFISGSRVEEVELEKKKAQFLYSDSGQAYFMDPATYDQFSLPLNSLSGEEKFLKEGGEYDLISANGEILNLELPRTLELMVTETGPGVKGDSVSNAYKSAILENGMTIQVPLFIKEGEKVKVDTKNGDYLERVKG